MIRIVNKQTEKKLAGVLLLAKLMQPVFCFFLSLVRFVDYSDKINDDPNIGVILEPKIYFNFRLDIDDSK